MMSTTFSRLWTPSCEQLGLIYILYSTNSISTTPFGPPLHCGYHKWNPYAYPPQAWQTETVRPWLANRQHKLTNMKRFLLSFLALTLGNYVSSNFVEGTGEGMRNKHLIIEAEFWRPYFYWDFTDTETEIPIDGTYQGFLYDLLLFMQKSRNFTFTMVHEADEIWGMCYSPDNCTGMIGMVNRKEVDFAIGNPYFKCLCSRDWVKLFCFRTL